MIDPRWIHCEDSGTPFGELQARARLAGQSRTRTGRYNGYSALAVATGDDFPPDSVYWMREAKAAKNALAEALGGNNYSIWVEMVWPGESIDAFTWRTICEMTEAALHEFEGGETDPEKLALAAGDKLKELAAVEVLDG